MYDPVGTPRRITRRGVKVALIMTVVALIGIVVTVVKTRPHAPPVDQLTLDQLGLMMVPDAAQTELVVAEVRARLAGATPGASPGAKAACAVASTPHPWNNTQRQNASTIVQVGVALVLP